MMLRGLALLASIMALAGCAEDGVPGEAALVDQVEGEQVGSDTDQWIMMRGADGAWQRVGLVFGYTDDREECEKAIAGLQEANYARDYLCQPVK